MEGKSGLGLGFNVRKCRLNQLRAGEGSDMMMRRLVMAVVLGIILGVGIAVAPSSPSLGGKANLLTTSPGAQRGFEAGTSPWLQFQPILLGLLAGLVLAVPVFLLARRRTN
jgi:hypothetical protein